MKRKDVIRSLICAKQDEIPFGLRPRELELPLDSRHIINVTGVRRRRELASGKLTASRKHRKSQGARSLQ